MIESGKTRQERFVELLARFHQPLRIGSAHVLEAKLELQVLAVVRLVL